jgi:TusA-related sulfurtransferase
MGLKCPQPALKVTVLAARTQPGDLIEVVADCATFEKDVREWSARARKTVLWCKDEGGGKKRIQIKV